MMMKIWFYGYATKVYSSRKIEDKLYKDVAFIYLTGMQKPDFKAISEFRRKNLSELMNSFVDILQICHRLGIVNLGDISIDSRVMKANASADKTYDEKELIKERQEMKKAIEEYLENAERTDLEEDQRYDSDKCGNELPEDISNKKFRIKKMKQVVEQLKQAQKRLKASNKKKINLTDNDAQFQKGRVGIILGYRAHIAVDTKEQVIVANDVTNQPNDTAELISMVDKVLENVKILEPERFSGTNQQQEKVNTIADAGYSSGNNLTELDKEQYKKKVEAYIPDTNYRNKNSSHKDTQFDKSKFVYNEQEDNITCPEGKKLHHIMNSRHRGVMYDIYGNTRECKSCQYFGKCTKSERGRHISISECQPFIDKMRQKLSSEEGKKIYALRKITAEPVFGNLSQNLGFREFLIRGKPKVRGEFSIMCTAHLSFPISAVYY